MGRDTRRLEIEGLVSRHNSTQDKIDDAIWQQLMEEVDSVIKKFNTKYPMFSVEIFRADHYEEPK